MKEFDYTPQGCKDIIIRKVEYVKFLGKKVSKISIYKLY